MFSPVNVVSVGASGAIFGLMSATFVVGRQLNADTSQILLLIVVNTLLGFQPGIDWRAHLGGAIAGAITASALARRPGAGNWAPVVGLMVGLVALVVVRTGQILSGA
jgi:membrane associated rhomboid family serine protease